MGNEYDDPQLQVYLAAFNELSTSCFIEAQRIELAEAICAAIKKSNSLPIKAMERDDEI